MLYWAIWVHLRFYYLSCWLSKREEIIKIKIIKDRRPLIDCLINRGVQYYGPNHKAFSLRENWSWYDNQDPYFPVAQTLSSMRRYSKNYKFGIIRWCFLLAMIKNYKNWEQLGCFKWGSMPEHYKNCDLEIFTDKWCKVLF